MKKSIIISFTFLLAVFCISTVSCNNSNSKKDIKNAAYQYLDAMANYKIDAAVPFCTEETQNSVLVIARNLVSIVEPGYIESDTPAKIKIKKIELTSDTTATVYYNKTTPIKNQNEKVNMLCRDGKWYVHIPMRIPSAEEIPHGEKQIIDGIEVYTMPQENTEDSTEQ